MKGLSIALGAYNAVFWRYAAGVVLVSLLYFRRRPARPGARAMRLYVIRGVLIAVMAFLFFWGLARTPLAEGVALSFIAPLLALYLAAVLLGETIGRSSILASLLGIAGVLVIVAGKMGGEFDGEAQCGVAAILLSAGAYAYNLVLQRQIAQIAGAGRDRLFSEYHHLRLPALRRALFRGGPRSAFFAGHRRRGGAGDRLAARGDLGLCARRGAILVSLEYSAFIWAVLLGWISSTSEA